MLLWVGAGVHRLAFGHGGRGREAEQKEGGDLRKVEEPDQDRDGLRVGFGSGGSHEASLEPW